MQSPLLVSSRLSHRFPLWLSGKESACNPGVAGDAGSVPELGRTPGGGHGNPLQYSCLENPKDRGAWRAIVHRVAKSRTRLSDLAGPRAGFPSANCKGAQSSSGSAVLQVTDELTCSTEGAGVGCGALGTVRLPDGVTGVSFTTLISQFPFLTRGNLLTSVKRYASIQTPWTSTHCLR